MEILPAIDIMNGNVVRLIRGKPDAQKTYSNFGDPLSVALRWQEEGADKIHIIDLDAALGLGNNIDSVNKVIKYIDIPIQLGGGIRSSVIARNLLENGVDRIILGSMTFQKPEVLESLVEEYGSKRIVVALDHILGKVVHMGWKENTGLQIDNILPGLLKKGVETFLITSVLQDGTMEGQDIETLIRIRNSFPKINIIAAGGLKDLNELTILSRNGIQATVIGKALYENRFSLRKALRVSKRIKNGIN